MKRFDINKLRDWQHQCINSPAAMEFIKTSNRKRLVLDVFPGCGKSILGAVIASKLVENGIIDHIVVLSPTCSVAAQWGNNAKRGEPKMPVLTFVNRAIQMQGSLAARQMKYPQGIMGHSTTYAAVPFSAEKHRDMIGPKTLVILDEVHHLADSDSAWGEAVVYACENAGKILLLSGTMYRHSKTRIPFIAYDENGLASSDFQFSYSMAIGGENGMKPCIRRPEFHMFDGRGEFVYTDDPQNPVRVDSFANAKPKDYPDCKALFLGGEGIEECIKSAVEKWRKYKQHDPFASMLIAANDIKHAADLKMFVESFVNERVFYVVSDDPGDNKTDTVDDFRQARGSIAVAVRQIAEGVDVPDIRVVVHATSYTTQQFNMQLWFRAGRNRTHADGRDDYAHGCGGFSVFVIDLPGIRKCVEDMVTNVPPAYVPPSEDPTGTDGPTGPGGVAAGKIVLTSEAEKSTVADYAASHVEVVESEVREACVVHYLGDLGYSLPADMRDTVYASIVKQHGVPTSDQIYQWQAQQSAVRAEKAESQPDERTIAERLDAARKRAYSLAKRAASLFVTVNKGKDFAAAMKEIQYAASKTSGCASTPIEQRSIAQMDRYIREVEAFIVVQKKAIASNRRTA